MTTQNKELDDDESWVEFGFVPVDLLQPERDTPNNTWVRVSVNTESGQIRQDEVSDEELSHAEERYVDFLVEHEIIDKDKKGEILGFSQ